MRRFRCAARSSIRVADRSVLASRISYVGELGWELTSATEESVLVWDALVRAGLDVDAGLQPFGYRALDALRIEKGYRYFGTDMTMLDTPYEAGLGALVRLAKDPFNGQAALATARERATDGSGRRLRTIRLAGGDAYLPVYGGEAVRLGGEVVGRLRSAAHGPTVGVTIGFVYLGSGVPEDTEVEVDVFDRRVPATVVADTMVDPSGERMRG